MLDYAQILPLNNNPQILSETIKAEQATYIGAEKRSGCCEVKYVAQ